MLVSVPMPEREVTFKGKQCPLQRAEGSGLVTGVDLLEEAVSVVAPQGTGKAVDPRCQLHIKKHNSSVNGQIHYK